VIPLLEAYLSLNREETQREALGEKVKVAGERPESGV
jgi:hypothetical protein